MDQEVLEVGGRKKTGKSEGRKSEDDCGRLKEHGDDFGVPEKGL